MSSSNQRPQIEDSVQFCDAPYPIIANFLACLHQNPFIGMCCNFQKTARLNKFALRDSRYASPRDEAKISELTKPVAGNGTDP